MKDEEDEASGAMNPIISYRLEEEKDVKEVS